MPLFFVSYRGQRYRFPPVRGRCARCHLRHKLRFSEIEKCVCCSLILSYSSVLVGFFILLSVSVAVCGASHLTDAHGGSDSVWKNVEELGFVT